MYGLLILLIRLTGEYRTVRHPAGSLEVDKQRRMSSCVCMCLRKTSLSIVGTLSKTVTARESALEVDTGRITACERRNLIQPDSLANHHLHLLPVRGEPERAVESHERYFHLTRVRSKRTVREYMREERETQVSTHVLGLHTYRAGTRDRSRFRIRNTEQADMVSPTPAQTLTSFVFDRRLACANKTLRLSLQC